MFYYGSSEENEIFVIWTVTYSVQSHRHETYTPCRHKHSSVTQHRNGLSLPWYFHL
jgi:hypothetical protein